MRHVFPEFIVPSFTEYCVAIHHHVNKIPLEQLKDFKATEPAGIKEAKKYIYGESNG